MSIHAIGYRLHIYSLQILKLMVYEVLNVKLVHLLIDQL